VKAPTRVAPDLINAVATSAIVLPEVITSSHSSTERPLTTSGASTRKAPPN
jgi:hypothetical protein